MGGRSSLFNSGCIYLALLILLAACTDSTWRDDPSMKAARHDCGSGPEADYGCIEQAAVTALNPNICRLAGIYIDDMCLQAVYEAANDPTICERIYLQGVVPNCRAYYAQSIPPSPTAVDVLPTQTLIHSPSFPPSPSNTPTSLPTLIATSTPVYEMDLSGYDPDIFPPIDVSHNPPLIARSDETARLVFTFANSFAIQFQVNPIPDGILHYTFGDSKTFQNLPLEYEIVEEMESLVARLPAADEQGRSLRYYAEFSVPEAGYTQRYPVEGTIDVITTDNLIPVELLPENPVAPGEIVYDFFWGFGPDKVRQATYEGYPRRVGPPAMDVANDGRIALMDPINDRIIIFNPKEGSYSSYPIPFKYSDGFYSDLAFDNSDHLMICDFAGQSVEGSFAPIPYCYRLKLQGVQEISAPVYVSSPAYIASEHKVLDYDDYRLVVPFDSAGEANSREDQRLKDTWDFPKLYVEGQDPYLARYADVNGGLAFEVHSIPPLGVLTEFEKTPQGYLLVFSLGDKIRGVWIDRAGKVLKDVTLPDGEYTEINFNSQAAVGKDGSLYVMSSTERGIEIHIVGAAQD